MNIDSDKILGKKVYAFKSKAELLNYIDNKHQILIALNAEKLNKNNPKLQDIINLNIGYTDGVGAVYALKRKGIKAIKIAGAEFWLDIITEYRQTKSFYLLGSTQDVIEQVVAKLNVEFPLMKIKGFRNGFLEKGDKRVLIETLQKEKPDIIFVAMGSPKQEFLMAELLEKHPALYMGLGGSFDVYSGNKKRAPKLFIKLGLEWLYRLLKEPTRLSRQLGLVKFFFKIIFGRT